MPISIQQYIFGLDVPMDDVPLMQIAQSFCDGLEELFGLCFLHPMLRFGEEIIIKGVGSSILLDEVYFGGAFDGVDEFGNDVVVEFGQDIYLPF